MMPHWWPINSQPTVTMPPMHQCPSCSADTIEIERFVLESTDGPIEHVRVVCWLGHNYMMLASDLGQS